MGRGGGGGRGLAAHVGRDGHVCGEVGGRTIKIQAKVIAGAARTRSGGAKGLQFDLGSPIS